VKSVLDVKSLDVDENTYLEVIQA